MKRLAVINCKKTKKPYACTVREMYSDSLLFKYQVEHVERYYDGWALLSTKYGVLYPDDVIEPYDAHMILVKKMYGEPITHSDRQEWARAVNAHHIWEQKPDCWINRHYQHLIKHDVKFYHPNSMGKMGIGPQIAQWQKIIAAGRGNLIEPPLTLEQMVERGLVV